MCGFFLHAAALVIVFPYTETCTLMHIPRERERDGVRETERQRDRDTEIKRERESQRERHY